MSGRLRRGLVVLAGVAALVLGTGAQAHADPTAAEIEAMLDAEFAKIEPIIEQYNLVESQLKENRAKAAALEAQLAPLEAKVADSMGQVNQMAIEQYKGGRATAFNAILGGGSLGALPAQLTQMEVVARSQRAKVSDVQAVRDQYRNDKRALDELIAQQSKQEAELGAKKAEIDARIKQLKDMRDKAYGGSPPKPVADGLTTCPIGGSGAGYTAAKFACDQRGKMYEAGAEGPNTFDCSGLTQTSWKQAGKSLPRTSQQQMQSSATTQVAAGELQVGDLVWYGSGHVAIYVGGGYIVHASRAGQPIASRGVAAGSTPTRYGRPK
jgi:cell wall-associated NlpC family hydrolase